MKKYILLDKNNKVCEIINEKDENFPNVPIEQRYSDELLNSCVIVEDVEDVELPWVGQVYVDGEFINPQPIEPQDNAEYISQSIKSELLKLDNARDAEDLFDILKAKGILSDTDLPATTIARFNQKKDLRQQLQQLS